MRRRIVFVALALIVAACTSARADRITLESGKEFDGTIIQEGDDVYTIALEHGTATLPKSVVKSIQPAPMPAPAPVPSKVPAPAQPLTPRSAPLPPALVKPVPAIGDMPVVAAEAAGPRRLPAWNTLTGLLAKQPWATHLMQIPATVVDRGQMRFVPYSSYRCGVDYEMNIYGDPDGPAGIEIGVYRTLLRSDAAKTNCLDFIASALPNRADAGIVKALDRARDLATHDGITIEVTPPTADDAYGGWWISVYDVKALDAARATPGEIEQITVAKSDAPAGPPDDPLYGWSADDIGRSRPSRGRVESVYVHGYYRSNGKYVSPHTRAAPGAGHGRR